jgi:hypothetical protein
MRGFFNTSTGGYPAVTETVQLAGFDVASEITSSPVSHAVDPKQKTPEVPRASLFIVGGANPTVTEPLAAVTVIVATEFPLASLTDVAGE